MNELQRLSRLLTDTIAGVPYYGPSAASVLRGIDAQTAASRPAEAVHSMWEIVAHIASELRYSAALLDGRAALWVAGETTWPVVLDRSTEAWDRELRTTTVRGTDAARPGN